jgi:molecular chaperone IbpA
MRNYDLSPFWRSTVGFDRVLDMMNDSLRHAGAEHCSPYNIERVGEDVYQISLALAGLTPSDVTITAEQNLLTIEGRKPEREDREYLYQGITTRPFRQQFNLAEYVQVKDASLEDGLLKIALAREVPEAMKPRKIEINDGAQQHRIDPKTAA